MVCTGNVCRSPLAERILARELDRRGVPAAVSSAGLFRDGMPAAPEILELLAAQGLDGSDHRSCVVQPEFVAGADLVLGMAREHVRASVLADPAAQGRAFTLKELVRRGRTIGARLGGEPLSDWLARAAAGRSPRDALGSSSEDDIRDPYGRGMGVYRRVAGEIGQLVSTLADLAWPVPTSHASAPRHQRA